MSDNKEIKPCMNTMCPQHCHNNEIHCGIFTPTGIKDCHKYTPTAPIIFTPKNPDDYVPGCRNEECRRFRGFLNVDVRLRRYANCYLTCNLDGRKTEPNHNSTHEFACSQLPCYDPAPKPKTRKVLHVAPMTSEDGAIEEIAKALTALGVPCEIIEEEIK